MTLTEITENAIYFSIQSSILQFACLRCNGIYMIWFHATSERSFVGIIWWLWMEFSLKSLHVRPTILGQMKAADSTLIRIEGSSQRACNLTPATIEKDPELGRYTPHFLDINANLGIFSILNHHLMNTFYIYEYTWIHQQLSIFNLHIFNNRQIHIHEIYHFEIRVNSSNWMDYSVRNAKCQMPYALHILYVMLHRIRNRIIVILLCERQRDLRFGNASTGNILQHADSTKRSGL